MVYWKLEIDILFIVNLVCTRCVYMYLLVAHLRVILKLL